jgi:hypothetical protein
MGYSFVKNMTFQLYGAKVFRGKRKPKAGKFLGVEMG